jgi:hypothetical protein
MGSHASPKDGAKPGCTRRELLYTVAVMLGREASKYCKQNVTQYVLKPMMERYLKSGKPYVRLGNLVVATAPGECLEAARQQLFLHMHEVASAAPWLDEVYGVIVTDDAHAEHYMIKREGSPELRAEGDPGKVVAAALAALCAGKIPLVSPEDVAIIFGV